MLDHDEVEQIQSQRLRLIHSLREIVEMVRDIDRRKSPRIKDPMALKIILDNLPGKILEDHTYSIDISSGGLYFISHIDLQPGDRFQMNIIPLHNSIIEFGMILNTSGVVLRSKRMGSSVKRSLVAAKFQSPPQWKDL